MKIYILVVLYGSQIMHEKKYITKEGCESSIIKDEYGTFVLGGTGSDGNLPTATIYNKGNESINSDRISKLRKKRIDYDPMTYMMNWYDMDFMCVESTL